MDYKQLNSHCVKDIYPLPRIDEMVSCLKKARIYLKYDVMWGYKRILMDPDSQHYAAIICKFGVYKPTIMLFGLQNAPAIFQRHMNYILRKLITTGKVFIYIDDILITTKDVEEHQRLTHRVIQALQDDGLLVRKRKCEFEVTEVTFLGLHITKGTVRHSPKKCQGIQDWPTPTTMKMVQEYVGLLNYF